MALAQGLGHDPRHRDLTLLADMALHADLAMLHDARDIVRHVEQTGLVFCLTHNYSGYPMVRQARAMVEGGQLGELRLVQVEYVQGGKAAEEDPDPAGELPWRYNPERGGASLVMGDIGTHAHHLVRFITGLEVAQVAAETEKEPHALQGYTRPAAARTTSATLFGCARSCSSC